jgi:serine protease Do
VVKALGLSLANLTPDLRDRYGLAADAEGVVITDIEAGGPSADKGMRVGDVVVGVTQRQNHDEAKKEGRESVLLLVGRQGDLRFVAVKLDKVALISHRTELRTLRR